MVFCFALFRSLNSLKWTIKNAFLAEDISSKVDGLFFAGDVRIKDVKQIATAVADGTLAGIKASK